MKRIFIGGTGRSGTSILLHALSFHPDLDTIPIETKFLVQVDGLHALASYLTTNYAPNDAAVAVSRFRKLMYEVITHTGDNPYADYADAPYGRMEFVPQDIFPNYFQVLDRFFANLEPHYRSRRRFIEQCRELVDSLFGERAIARGCNGWVEKTPINLVRIEFLYELYPDAIFVNCVRDPRGVLHSFQRLKWLNGTPEEGAKYLAAYYDYLDAKREVGLARPHQYHEVRLEDLVADPLAVVARLLEFLGSAPYDEHRNEYLITLLRQGSLRWSTESGRYQDIWERDYSEATRTAVTAILADAIARQGYID